MMIKKKYFKSNFKTSQFLSLESVGRDWEWFHRSNECLHGREKAFNPWLYIFKKFVNLDSNANSTSSLIVSNVTSGSLTENGGNNNTPKLLLCPLPVSTPKDDHFSDF